jgi:hypothetical protein
MPSLIRADTPDTANNSHFFDLLLDGPIRNSHDLSKIRYGNRRIVLHEFDDFLGTFL